MPRPLRHASRPAPAFLLLAVASLPPCLKAQFASPPAAVLGVNAGNSSVLSTQPFTAGPTGRRFLYVLGDLTAAAQTVSSLTLQSDAAVGSAARAIDVRVTMGHAAAGTALAPNPAFAANYVAGSATVVLDDGSGGHALQLSLPATPNGFDPVALPLNHTFAWNGTDELIVEFDTLNSTSVGAYSLDVESGTTTSVGTFRYNGLVGCQPQGPGLRQDIFGVTPATNGRRTTCSQYMDDGPASLIGILVIGLTDPNTTFNGSLCAPLRASLDVTDYFVVTDAMGRVGSATSPTAISFPDAGLSFTFYTQFVIVDPSHPPPELAVSLSDGLQWDITPPTARARGMVFDTGSNTASTGTISALYPPVMFFN